MPASSLVPHENIVVAQRYARLHLLAANVRLLDLEDLIKQIHASDHPITSDTPELQQALSAAQDIVESLSAAHRRLSPVPKTTLPNPSN